MSADIQRGACYDLAPAVFDKYFANGRNGLSLYTARAICGHCAIQATCLEEAIVEPPGHGVRAGIINSELWRLHGRWMDDHEEADVLAAEALDRERVTMRQQRYNLRLGRSLTVPLAFPEMGGAA